MFYAVIYQLKNKTKDYSNLFNKIKSYGTWMHYIDTLWIIQSSLSADAISESLFPFIDQSKDYLLVIRITSEYQGYLPKDAWEWMSKHKTIF